MGLFYRIYFPFNNKYLYVSFIWHRMLHFAVRFGVNGYFQGLLKAPAN